MAKRTSTSRSEEIRAKREASPKRTSARKSQPVDDAPQRNMPPVVMRGDFAAAPAPTRKKKTKAPKRRYDIALDAPGGEISLPALPTLHLGWRAASLILVVALLALLNFIWDSPLYRVQAAEVQGVKYLSAAEVNRWMNVSNALIFSLDPAQLEEDLRIAFPGLVGASVQIELPAKVIVTLEERQPVIAWEIGNEIKWVDAAGFGFDPLGEDDTLVRVSANEVPSAPIGIAEATEEPPAEENPLETVTSPVAFTSPAIVEAVLTIQTYLPNGAILIYDGQHGLGWRDRREWDVYLGTDVSEIEMKLNIYKAIWQELKAQGIRPALISVEYLHAPYYRLEP